MSNKYNWLAGVAAGRTIESINFVDCPGIEAFLNAGRHIVYYETPKGLLIVSWEKPRCS